MTETEIAILDAIGGGYKELGTLSFEGSWFEIDVPNTNALYQIDVAGALIDPVFWQSIGKVRGWGKIGKVKHWIKPKTYTTISSPKARTREGYWKEVNTLIAPEWLEQQHRFIDHLADGLSFEEAFIKLK